MKTAVIIIAIGAAIYYSLYGAAPLEGVLKQVLKSTQGESQISPAAPKTEGMKALAAPKPGEQKPPAALNAQQWKDAYRPSPDCQNPTTALRKLECKNMEDNARRAFERK